MSAGRIHLAAASNDNFSEPSFKKGGILCMAACTSFSCRDLRVMSTLWKACDANCVTSVVDMSRLSLGLLLEFVHLHDGRFDAWNFSS